MIAIGLLYLRMLFDYFKPRQQLEAEILVLRHQLNVLQQRAPRRRLHLRWVDRVLPKVDVYPVVYPTSAGSFSASSQVLDLIGAPEEIRAFVSLCSRCFVPPRRRPELTQAVQEPRRIRIDHVRVRASDPRNRADGLKIGRIPLTRHAAERAR
jgi:hypothetical protein